LRIDELEDGEYWQEAEQQDYGMYNHHKDELEFTM
jgi:hypothetical protein